MIIEKNKYASLFISSTILFVGLLVVVGWFFDIGLFKSLHPNFVTMKINTAIGFIAVGLALFAFYYQKKYLTVILGVFVLVLGVATLSQYVFGANFGIDELIIRDVDLVQTSHPGRMSPATALNFSVFGLIIVLLGFGLSRLAVSLTLLPLLVAFISLSGYVFGVQSLYKIYLFTSIALHTLLVFLLIGVNIFVLEPRVFFVGIFTENRLGGIFVRSFLPIVILIPFLLGWCILTGEKLGYYDSSFSFSLLVVFTIVFTTIFLFV